MKINLKNFLPKSIKRPLRMIFNGIKKIIQHREKLYMYVKMNGLFFTLKQVYFMYIYKSHAVTFENLPSTGEDIDKKLYSVSIVIPTYNGLSDLYRLIPQLLSQKGFSTIEIVIVDSSSSDGTPSFIDNFKEITFVPIAQKDFSHSYARNLGFTYTSNDIVLFMVQDAMPTSQNWLYEFMHIFKKLEVVALSCKQLPNVNADLYACYGLAQFNNFLNIQESQTRVVKKYIDNTMLTRKLAQLDNVACLVKSNVFKNYMFEGNYAEDLDLGLRLIKDGYKIGVTSEVSVIHSHLRPTYYHMKRAMVETEVIENMLGKHEKVNSVDNQLADMLVTAFLIAHLLGEVKLFESSLSLSEFTTHISTIMDRLLSKEYSKNESTRVCEILEKYDKNFANFIAYLCENEIELEKGELFYHMHFVNNEAINFMTSKYNTLDKKIYQEYLFFMLNSYGTFMGIRFAQNKKEYLLKYDFLNDLFEKMYEGV